VDLALFVEALYAIGIGLVVGFEREHHDLSHGLDPHEAPGHDQEQRETVLGARTFALLGLIGWLLGVLGDAVPWALPAGIVAVTALVALQHLRSPGDYGLTTEVAAVGVALLGALVRSDPALAVAIALITTFLLAAKPWTRSLLLRARRIEVTATIQLLILVAIVLPILPPEPLDPWDALPPRKVGMFVVLIAGVQYVGYVLTRVLGPDRGVCLTGLLGGLTSSTAVTMSMARAARETPDLTRQSRLAVYLANVVMPVRVAVISGLISAAVGRQVAVALAGMVLVLLVAALVEWRALRGARHSPGQPLELSNPLSLWSALLLGAVLCAVLLISTIATAELGRGGLFIAAVVSGFADVDAVTLSAAEQAHAGSVDAATAALAIAIAVAANSVAKAGMAIGAGGRGFGVPVAIALGAGVALSMAVAGVGALL
jgi:uncharacterized membrane protein (DUF4010 family)